MTFFRRLVKALLWVNLVMASSGAGWVALAFYECDGSFHLLDGWFFQRAYLMPFISIIGMYLLDRTHFEDLDSDLMATPRRAVWMHKHSSIFRTLGWAILFCVAVMALTCSQTIIVLLLCMLIIGGSYPFWKKLPYAKYMNAVAWSGACTVVPCLSTHAASWESVAVLSGITFLLVFSQININDLRDVTADRKYGTKSIAALHGVGVAKAIGVGACIMAIALAGSNQLAIFYSILLIALVTIVLTLLYRPDRDGLLRLPIEGQSLFGVLVVVLEVGL